jgi:hypothetical protein
MASDIRVGFMVVNDIRCRTFERLFGVQRDQANLLTAVALLTAAAATYDRMERLRNVPRRPSAGEAGLSSAIWKEALQGVAGPSSRDTRLFGTLMTLAVLGGAVGPGLEQSAHAVARASHRAGIAFHHRYGHLIGRPRRR